MSGKYEKLKARLDEEIRRGHGSRVQRELRSINLARIPREFAADFANLARRVRLPRLSLQILRPVIRPDRPLNLRASPKELSAYAAALSRLGVIEEAFQILEKIEDADFAEASLQIAFAHIFRWDYSAAIPWLRRYIRRTDINTYERFIGKINLAAAYAADGSAQECDDTATEVISVSLANNWRLLATNAYEIWAQRAIRDNDWPLATERLAAATSLAEADQIDDRFIKKWKLIVSLNVSGPTPEVLSATELFKAESLERQDWETVRYCDYAVASVLRDTRLYTHVYAGTPYPSFRHKMKAEAWFPLPEEYRWCIGGAKANRAFDMSSGLELDGPAALKPHQGPHRLLMALSWDFYRPTMIGAVSSRVFPDEYFDPKGSPKRIEQLTNRLRKWFNENQIPLTIRLREGALRLNAEAPFDLLLPVRSIESTNPLMEQKESKIETLKTTWPYKAFSSRQAGELLGLDVEAIRQLIKEAEENNLITRIGTGRGTLFRFRK